MAAMSSYNDTNYDNYYDQYGSFVDKVNTTPAMNTSLPGSGYSANAWGYTVLYTILSVLFLWSGTAFAKYYRCRGDACIRDVETPQRVRRGSTAAHNSDSTVTAGLPSAYDVTAGLPPAYDVALSMPKPQVGESVRFQNEVDGGWCMFTWVNQADDGGPPPQYIAFTSRFVTASTTAVINETESRASGDEDGLVVEQTTQNDLRRTSDFEINDVQSPNQPTTMSSSDGEQREGIEEVIEYDVHL